VSRISTILSALAETAVATGDRRNLESAGWCRALRTDASRLNLTAPPPLLGQRLRAVMAARRGEVPALVGYHPETIRRWVGPH
jgi:hypothetical protein